jgi:hypothetical protein
MRRYLVVAHQTLSSPELLEAMQTKAAQEDTAFHLVVPFTHSGAGATWTEGEARAQAQHHLDDAAARLAAEGLTVTGEVGADNPVDAADDVLQRDGSDGYTGIIMSTLPVSVSKWLKLDAPSRLQRRTTLTVEHVIGHPAEVRA